MFRPYRYQCEAARKQIDQTCFASSPQGQGSQAEPSSSASRLSRMGQPFRLSQKPNIDGTIGKSDPANSAIAYAFSRSRNLRRADSLRRDSGSRRRNRLNTTLRAGVMENAFNNPNATSFSAQARGTMAIPPSDCTIILMVSILSTTAKILGLMPRSVNSDSTT